MNTATTLASAALSSAGMGAPSIFGMGSGSDGSEKGERYIKYVQVDMSKVERLRKIHRRNPIVSSSMFQFMRSALRSDIGIKLVSGDGRETEFDTKLGINKRYFDDEMNEAIETMAFECLLYGFTCVSVGTSKVVDGALRLIVLPSNVYSATIRWDVEYARSYHVTLANSTMNKYTAQLAKNTRFITMYPPDNEGNPSSPVAQCLFRLIAEEKFWMDKLRQSHFGSHPPIIYNQDGSAGSQLLMPESEAIQDAMGHVGQVSTSAVRQLSEEAYNSLREKQTMQAFEERQQLNLSESSSSSSSYGFRLFNGGASNDMSLDGLPEISASIEGDPVRDRFVAPLGQKLERGLDFKSVENFESILSMIHKPFFAALGLPEESQSYKSDRSMQFMQKKLNTTIVDFHRMFSIVLSKAFDPVLKAYLMPEIGSRLIIEDTSSSRKRQRIGDEDGDSGDAGDSSSSDEVDGVADDNDDDDDGNDDMNGDTNYNNKALKGRIRDELRNSTVDMSFQTIPEITFELLLQMVQSDTVKIGDFRRLALSYVNVKDIDWKKEGNETNDLYYSEFVDRREEKRQRVASELDLRPKNALLPTNETSPISTKTEKPLGQPEQGKLMNASGV